MLEVPGISHSTQRGHPPQPPKPAVPGWAEGVGQPREAAPRLARVPSLLRAVGHLLSPLDKATARSKHSPPIPTPEPHGAHRGDGRSWGAGGRGEGAPQLQPGPLWAQGGEKAGGQGAQSPPGRGGDGVRGAPSPTAGSRGRGQPGHGWASGCGTASPAVRAAREAAAVARPSRCHQPCPGDGDGTTASPALALGGFSQQGRGSGCRSRPRWMHGTARHSAAQHKPLTAPAAAPAPLPAPTGSPNTGQQAWHAQGAQGTRGCRSPWGPRDTQGPQAQGLPGGPRGPGRAGHPGA